MDQDVVYIHNVLLVIKKENILPSAATWMDLEIVILSSKSEKDRFLTISVVVQMVETLSVMQETRI